MLYFTHLCAVVIFPIGNMILLLLHDICIIFTFLQTWGATPRTRHINLSSSLPVSWDLISVIQIMAVMTAEKIAIQVAPSQLKSCHNPRLSKPVGWSSQTEGSIRSVRGTLADPREAGEWGQFSNLNKFPSQTRSFKMDMTITTNLVLTKDRGGPSARHLISSQHSEQQIYNLRNNHVVLRGPG